VMNPYRPFSNPSSMLNMWVVAMHDFILQGEADNAGRAARNAAHWSRQANYAKDDTQ
jgi:hypothetical protein